MNISIVIITDKIKPDKLSRLFDSLKPSLVDDAEILLLCESGESNQLKESNSTLPFPPFSVPVRYIPIPEKQGISFNRNQGIKHAQGNIIVFIDDDCWVHPAWLKELVTPLQEEKVMTVTSGTKILPSNLLGDCISALGFPGGGSLGFDKVWKVSPEGFTNHMAVGNCAIKKELFSKVGEFDEKMKYGAEDAEFSYRLEKAGIPIKYEPNAFAYHEARTTLRSFVHWQLRRGKANYHFQKKVDGIGQFVKLRCWSAQNILKSNLFNLRLPIIFTLLISSLILQQTGYIQQHLAERKKK